MTSACLLIGNGINRCCGGLSWEELLQKIAHRYFISTDTVSSCPIAFEQLKCAVLSRNIKLQSDEFAFDILAELDTLQTDKYAEILEQFMKLHFHNILTTNFDYLLERTLIADYQYDKYTHYVVIPQETKCSRIRHSKINDVNIYHIHGELGKKGTICLGNVHYATNLKAIMDTVLDYCKETDTYSLKEKVFSDDLISWAQFFFTRDIYIVGLGLYDCDMDLWWLIAYRRQLILSGEKRINNKVVYYYLFNEEKDQQFKECLESMSIEVRERKIDNKDWKSNYIAVAEDIRNCLLEE